MVRRALSPDGKAENWIEKNRLDREIKPPVQAQACFRRQITVDSLRKDASSISLADVAARIKKVNAASDVAQILGKELNPREFTEFFADKSTLKTLVALRKYSLPAQMENIYSQAISRAKKEKVADPDGVPMEILEIGPRCTRGRPA